MTAPALGRLLPCWATMIPSRVFGGRFSLTFPVFPLPFTAFPCFLTAFPCVFSLPFLVLPLPFPVFAWPFTCRSFCVFLQRPRTLQRLRLRRNVGPAGGQGARDRIGEDEGLGVGWSHTLADRWRLAR